MISPFCSEETSVFVARLGELPQHENGTEDKKMCFSRELWHAIMYEEEIAKYSIELVFQTCFLFPQPQQAWRACFRRDSLFFFKIAGVYVRERQEAWHRVGNRHSLR